MRMLLLCLLIAGDVYAGEYAPTKVLHSHRRVSFSNITLSEPLITHRGKVYFYHEASSQLGVIHIDTGKIRRIGAEGMGPGEYRTLSLLSVQQEVLFGFDYDQKNMHAWDLTGRHIDTVLTPMGFTGTIAVDPELNIYYYKLVNPQPPPIHVTHIGGGPTIRFGEIPRQKGVQNLFVYNDVLVAVHQDAPKAVIYTLKGEELFTQIFRRHPFFKTRLKERALFFENNPKQKGHAFKIFFTSAGTVVNKRLYIAAVASEKTPNHHVLVFEFQANNRMRIVNVLHLKPANDKPLYIGSIEVDPEETNLTVYNQKSRDIFMFKL